MLIFDKFLWLYGVRLDDLRLYDIRPTYRKVKGLAIFESGTGVGKRSEILRTAACLGSSFYPSISYHTVVTSTGFVALDAVFEELGPIVA